MNDNNSATSQENQIDLKRLWAICRRHFKTYIVWTILLGIIGFVVAEFVVTPQYTASTQILVNQKHGSSDQAYNNQQADIQMINTYKDIITNQVILKEASKQLNNPVKIIRPARKAVYRETPAGRKVLIRSSRPAVVKRLNDKSYSMSTAQLKKATSIKTQQNSQVFTLNVKTNNAEKSAAVANTISSVFKSKIKSIMSVNNVTIVSRAAVPSSPSFPNKKLFALAGAILGLVLSFIWTLVKDLMDTTVKTNDFLTNDLGLTNLGSVNHIHMDLKAGAKHKETRRHRRV